MLSDRKRRSAPRIGGITYNWIIRILTRSRFLRDLRYKTIADFGERIDNFFYYAERSEDSGLPDSQFVKVRSYLILASEND